MQFPRFFAMLALVFSLSFSLSACAGAGLDSPADSAGLAEARPGVNGFLWRAALEVAAPLPLRQASQAEGVIITDWRQLPEKPDERASLVIYILDQRLAAGSLRVEVFRQQRTGDVWEDMSASALSAALIADAVLARAQELHSSARTGG